MKLSLLLILGFFLLERPIHAQEDRSLLAQMRSFECKIREGQEFYDVISPIDKLIEQAAYQLTKKETFDPVLAREMLRLADCAGRLGDKSLSAFEYMLPALKIYRKQIEEQIPKIVPKARQKDIRNSIRDVLREEKEGNG